jgi:hypothetical protein
MGQCCGRELQHPRTRASGRRALGLGDISAACPPCRIPVAEALSRNRPSQDPVFRRAACSGHVQGSFFPVAVGRLQRVCSFVLHEYYKTSVCSGWQ